MSGPALLALLSALSSKGEGDAPAGSLPAPKNVLQIQAKEIWTGGGQRVANGVLIVADGHVRAIGAERDIDPAQPLWKHDGVVTAGLIACGTASGARGELQDDTRSVTETARAAFAFDAHSRDFARALAAGITAVSLQPGPDNLVGGLACVVKTANGRVVSSEANLALSLCASTLGRSTSQGGFQLGASEGEDLARPDGGPENSARNQRGTREPTSYAGALAMLDALFARNAGPFARAARGELPVTIEAWDRHEVVRAVQFAQAHRLVGAIRGAPLAGEPEVLAALKESKLGVIVGPFSADQTRPSLESVLRLSEAGVPVAFALDAPAHAPEELRLSAVRARVAGAKPEAVWKALTEDAARLAGVGEALGRLAPGQEADFVLWSGDPLDLQSRVVAVFVDGARAWPAPSAR